MPGPSTLNERYKMLFRNKIGQYSKSITKDKAQAVIDYNDAAQKLMQMIESKAQEQEHKIETGTTLPKKK